MSSSLFTQTGVPAEIGAAIADAITEAVGRAERAAAEAEATKDALPAEVATAIASDPTVAAISDDVADHATRLTDAETNLASNDGRITTIEADLTDHETRIVALEGIGGVRLPTFIPAASSVVVSNTDETPLPVPVITGVLDTLTLAFGAAPLSGTIRVNGVATTLPAAIAEGDTISIDYADNPVADLTQTGELVLTATNAAGSATHTMTVSVVILVPVLTGPTTLTLDETSFTLIGATLEHADAFTVVALPAVGTYYEAEGGAQLVAGATYDASILATMGAVGGAVDGSGTLTLRAINENASATLSITVTVDVDQSVIARSVALDAGTTTALGATLPSGATSPITVTAIPASGAVEKLIPETTTPGSGWTARWELTTSGEDPTVTGAGATTGLSTIGFIDATGSTITFTSGLAVKTGTSASAFLRHDAVWPTDSYSDSWRCRIRLLLPSAAPDKTGHMMLFSHTDGSDRAFVGHDKRFVLHRESGDRLSARINTSVYQSAVGTGNNYFLYDDIWHDYEVTWSSADNTIRWLRDGVEHTTITGVTQIWSPTGAYNARIGSTNGTAAGSPYAFPTDSMVEWFEFGEGGTDVIVPASWEAVTLSSTLTEGELEGLRVNANGVAADTAMGTFSWRTADATPFGEDVTLRTNAGGGGGTPGAPDPERLTLTVQPLDGPLKDQLVSIDTSAATLLDSTTPVRGGVQYRWALPELDLGAHEHTTYPANQTDVLQFYLTYIDGGTYDGRFEIQARIPPKTSAQGGQNGIGRAYRWRITWDGSSVELYPNDPDPAQRSFPHVGTGNVVLRPNQTGTSASHYYWEGHTRSTGWRWASQKIEADWTKLNALMATYAVLPHNDTHNTPGTVIDPVTKAFTGMYDADGVPGQGWGNPASTYSATSVLQEGQIRYGLPTVKDEWGATRSYSTYVGDVPRQMGMSGDRECLGWEMESAASAIVFHRKGNTTARDNAWKHYQAICDAIEQYPIVFLWNFEAHRPLRPDDSGDRANPYAVHNNSNTAFGNPNFIQSTQRTGWGGSMITMSHLFGYGPTAYLLTEDPYYLELTQMLAMYAAIHRPGHFKQNSRDHVCGEPSVNERAMAWAIRALNRGWKATTVAGAIPTTRFLSATALNAFQTGTNAYLEDLANFVDTSGDGLPSSARDTICGTPMKALGVIRGFTTTYSLMGAGSPMGAVSAPVRQTSIFMMDYLGFTMAAAVLGGASAFRPYAERLFNGYYKLRADTGGGFFVPYAVPSHPSSEDTSIQDGGLLWPVHEEANGEGTAPYLASTPLATPTAWRERFATYDLKGPDTNYLFANNSDNGYGDSQRFSLAFGVFNLIKQADDAGLITSSVNWGAARTAFYNAIRASAADTATTMPFNFSCFPKWMTD